MPRIRDIQNQRFGNWLTLERAPNSADGRARWLCECQCGSGIRKTLYSTNLIKGNTRGCGCNYSKRLLPYEALYRRVRDYGASYSRTIEFTLSYEEFVEFTKQDICFYCHSPVTWAKYNVTWNGSAYNLDRKDNDKGYTKENCIVCCGRCNKGKNKLFTFNEWYEMTECFRKRKTTC